MGTQQLLLIILGVIIIGAAIVAGINLLSANAVENNRQECINRIALINDLAQAYFKKPVEQNGGGNSFTGFEINEELSSKNEIFRKVTINVRAGRDRIIVTARGREIGIDGRRPIIMRGQIDLNELTISITN
jgi:hypothetical protein